MERAATGQRYLFVLETPGIPSKSNPNDPGAGEPGGVPATPNTPMAPGTGWKLCTWHPG